MIEIGFTTWEKTVDEGNRILLKGMINEDDLKESVIENAGFGKLDDNAWEIIKKKRGGYHLFIKDPNNECKNIYHDPDERSEKLYILAAYKYTQKAKKRDLGIEFVIIERNRSFRLLAKSKDREYCLGGDWIITWADLNELFKKKEINDKEEMSEIIRRSHTLKWHTFWPSIQVDRCKTVNQARRELVNITDTLEVLKQCWEEKFDSKYWEHKRDRNEPFRLERAFCQYKDWYNLFESIEDYIDFWDLLFVRDVDFVEKELVGNNYS